MSADENSEKKTKVISKPKKAAKRRDKNALPDGTELQGYTIQKHIGSGGFGIVYKAYNHDADRTSAIKEFFPAGLVSRDENFDLVDIDEEDRESVEREMDRFRRTTRMLAQLNHPNVVNVQTYTPGHNTGYMFMDYHEGPNLTAWLHDRGGSAKPSELKPILLPIMDAVDTVHKNGYVHRDIAPDNVIITENNQPILIDFGAASKIREESTELVARLTEAGTQGIRKRHYSPPEASSSRTFPEPSTDIYSLGALMYFALTGKRPMDSDDRTQEMIRASSTLSRSSTIDRHVTLSEMQLDSVRPQMAFAIDKAMSMVPEERYQTIAQFMGDMEWTDGNVDIGGGAATGGGSSQSTLSGWKKWGAIAATFAVMMFGIMAFADNMPRPIQDLLASVDTCLDRTRLQTAKADGEAALNAFATECRGRKIVSKIDQSMAVMKRDQLTEKTRSNIAKATTKAPINTTTKTTAPKPQQDKEVDDSAIAADRKRGERAIATNNPQLIEFYVSNCEPHCVMRADALAKIETLKANKADEDQSRAAIASNSMSVMQSYLDTCSACQYRGQVRNALERRRTELDREEYNLFQSALNARDSSALRQLADSCSICTYRDQARAKATQYDRYNAVLRSALQCVQTCDDDIRNQCASRFETSYEYTNAGGRGSDVDRIRAAASQKGNSCKPALAVPNGTYSAARGYNRRQRGCNTRYRIGSVNVSNGRIRFRSGGHTWQGRIDQQSGHVRIAYSGITRRRPNYNTWIDGNAIQGAQLFNGKCGNGFFRLNIN